MRQPQLRHAMLVKPVRHQGTWPSTPAVFFLKPPSYIYSSSQKNINIKIPNMGIFMCLTNSAIGCSVAELNAETDFEDAIPAGQDQAALTDASVQ